MKIKCIKCGKNLGEVKKNISFEIEIKCTRCKTKHTYKIEAPEVQG